MRATPLRAARPTPPESVEADAPESGEADAPVWRSVPAFLVSRRAAGWTSVPTVPRRLWRLHRRCFQGQANTFTWQPRVSGLNWARLSLVAVTD